jgi:serine/threonine-protein kinase
LAFPRAIRLDAGRDFSHVQSMPEDRALPLEGKTIGTYVLGRELGRGGAATVYFATDLKHHRSVALKLLNADTSSALGGDRFRREIEVVAQLQHPHILPLHDSGEVDGQLYYVMPLVTGETLRDRIAREGALPISDVRRIVSELAAALDYAHRRGVVHRDVKPANILLDDEHATIADFGIAHRAVNDSADQLTVTGIIIGTPTYMSPEQSTGSREVDARTDVYSLGCVVFEMLTGVPPFRASSLPALVTQHLQSPVASARELRPELPGRADEVLRKALAKDPADRFGSMRELAAAIGEVLEASSSHTTRPVWIALGAAAAIAATVFALRTRPFAAVREAKPPSIAVLPFTNMSDSRENEYFSDGITEELTGALAQLRHMRVTPRTTAFAYKGRTGDIRSIGRALGVTRIVEGSVRRAGDSVRIVVALYDVESGERVLNETYDREFRSVLTLQTEIASSIAERLDSPAVPADRARLAARHTRSYDAYDSYLKGRHAFDQRTAASLADALTHFQRALQIDPNYARAHAGLADTYSLLAWVGFDAPSRLFKLAEVSAKRAVQLDSTIAESHLSLGIINLFHKWDWGAADRETKRAIMLDSTFAQAWFFRTWHLVAAGRYDDAMTSLQRARELDPLSPVTMSRIGSLHLWAGRYREADSVARLTLEMHPGTQTAQLLRARLLSLMGDHRGAIAALPPDSVRLGTYESGVAGFVYARAGRRQDALAAAGALQARSYVPAEGVAAIYAGLGDADRAFQWLDSAITSRGVGTIFLGVEPMYDTLRTDSRFARVIEQIGIVQPRPRAPAIPGR